VPAEPGAEKRHGHRGHPQPPASSTAFISPLLHRIEERLRTVNDGVIDHLPVDLDGGQSLASACLNAAMMRSARASSSAEGRYALFHRADLIGCTHSGPGSRRAGCARVPPEGFRFLEMKPRAVRSGSPRRRAGGEHEASRGICQLGPRRGRGSSPTSLP